MGPGPLGFVLQVRLMREVMRFWTPLLLVWVGLCAVACKDAKAEPTADEIEAQKDVPVEKIDIEVGEGEAVGEAYKVMITYVGKFKGGDIPFDSNDAKDTDGKPTKPPYVVNIGASRSIKGLEEGIVGMKKGGVRKLLIPWQKGYGLKGSGETIPPKSDLEFMVTLHDFVAPTKEAEFDWDDIKVGSGRAAVEGDRITVHYRCGYTNGMMFDDSRKRGEKGTPYTFRIGGNEAIQGVDHGVRGMKVGGIRKVWVPPLLAFGEAGYLTIQGGQIILVDVELLDIE